MDLNDEQYTNLLSLLDKKGPDNLELPNTESLINLVGTHSFSSQLYYKKWIIDSGCTDHICNDLSVFFNVQDISGFHHKITTPDGTIHTVHKRGSVQLHKNLTLHNVLYMHVFKFNLIFVYKICSELDVNVLFPKAHCFIRDPIKKTPLPLGNIEQGLYYTTVTKATADLRTIHCHTQAGSITSKAMLDLARLWHLRLGCSPFTKLKVLILEIDPKSIKDNLNCSICLAARQSRLPFTPNYIKTSKAFDLLHIDIWDPYAHKTTSGCTFFLTIVDDFTRVTWLYLLKNKSDCFDMIKHLFAYIQNQFHMHVKVVRSDNAKELCADNMLKIYNDLGIEHQKSCRDTPQQNGVVERKHKHLLETTRALFFQSNLPHSFWGECIVCATYIINCLLLSYLQNVSPYEKLFGTPLKNTLTNFWMVMLCPNSKTR